MSPTAWAVLASALLQGQPAVHRNQRALLSPQAPALKETYIIKKENITETNFYSLDCPRDPFSLE